MTRQTPPAADASKTLGKAAEQSRESYHGGGDEASLRSPGRKDPQSTGQNAREKDNVPSR